MDIQWIVEISPKFITPKILSPKFKAPKLMVNNVNACVWMRENVVYTFHLAFPIVVWRCFFYNIFLQISPNFFFKRRIRKTHQMGNIQERTPSSCQTVSDKIHLLLILWFLWNNSVPHLAESYRILMFNFQEETNDVDHP